jgi:hypothetical protein
MAQSIEHRDRPRVDQTWLEDHASGWVRAGLITDEQAVAVQHYEKQLEEERVQPQGRRAALALPGEVGAYVGIVVTLAGALVALHPHWQAIPLPAQLLLAAAVAVVGFGCGTWLVGIDEAGTRRLGMLLWVLGSAGTALGSALVVDAIGPGVEGRIALAAGLPLLITGLVLWRNLDRPLQMLTWMSGMGASVGGLGALLGLASWVIGCIGWMLAAGWWILTLRVSVRPLIVARCLASVAALLSAFMLMEFDERVGALAATLTGAVIIGLALWTRMIPVLIMGALGTLLAAQTLVQTTLRGAGTGAVLVLGGLLMVVTIVLRLQRRFRTDG